MLVYLSAAPATFCIFLSERVSALPIRAHATKFLCSDLENSRASQWVQRVERCGERVGRVDLALGSHVRNEMLEQHAETEVYVFYARVRQFACRPLRARLDSLALARSVRVVLGSVRCRACCVRKIGERRDAQ